MMEIKSRIKNEMVQVDWLSGLLPLQPDNIKVPINYGKLRNSITKHGFSVAFAVWFDPEAKAYRSVDGHTRKDILIELKSEGAKVPKTLQAYEIEADSEAHAFEILTECFNMKSNPFDFEVLNVAIEKYELDVDFDSLNVFVDKYEEEEEGEEGDVYGGGGGGGGQGNAKEQSNMIVITLNDEEQEEWLEFKEKVGKMKDKIVFYELLNFYKNEKGII